MIESLSPGGWLLVATGALDVAILLAVAVTRLVRRARTRRREWVRDFMRVAYWSASVDEVTRVVQKNADGFLEGFIELSDSVKLPSAQTDKARLAVARAHQFPRLLRQLESRKAYHRKRAALWLGFAAPDQAVRPIALALEKEPRTSVRLHMVHSLTRLGDPAAIPVIVDSLAGTDVSYQQRILGCLLSFGEDFLSYFEIFSHRREPEIQRLVAQMAATIADERGREYLESLLGSPNADLRRLAARLLLTSYRGSIDYDELLEHEDRMLASLALEFLGDQHTDHAFDLLVEHLDDEYARKSATVGLSRLVRGAPGYYDRLLDLIVSGEAGPRLDGLLDVMAQRSEYLVERVLRTQDAAARTALVKMVARGRCSGVLAFFNRNEDPAAEALLVDLLRSTVHYRQHVLHEFALYAKASVLGRLGIERDTVEQRRGQRVGEATRPILILVMILSVVVLPPAVYVFLRWLAGSSLAPLQWAAAYMESFERFFGGYAFTLNMIYLGLLVAAARSVVSQQANLNLKPLSMLFSPWMLPSISIIVPAYREEATIVENVNSLMNLRYPDFEVIVVNDGSPDGTMATLIEHFELERTDVFVHGYLGTQPIRGIYRNPAIPELLVIDKFNGGKADSLNAGINAAKKEYFAAIDSDSLLERDSLLRLAAQFLDSDVPVVATGGNIFPVNGCEVDRGTLTSIALPRKLLGRYQTLEYLRSFMAGRTGWAHLKSLMIISGAFGLFRKKDVVDSHGYLTGSGFYGKDTVAEDMELVVRVARTLREARRPFAIQYAYNANCWTEVPTSLRILRSQRDRWQRGLIDTMFFHFRMILNPRYGTMGMVGFPYYFLFELLGPWIEVQGLVFLVTGLATGAISLSTAAIVFAATVPLGVAVSLSSLMLAEYHQAYFGKADRLRLLVLAVVENFGYRQYASVLRLRGYISALTRKTGWGTMVRAGFSGRRDASSADGRSDASPAGTAATQK